MGLTAKQKLFVQEYLVDLNATQAAIRAGYSAKTAKQQGARLLTNVDIAAAVSEANANRLQKAEVDAAWLLRRFTDDLTADLADLYYPETGQLKPVHDWPLIWRQGLVAGVEVEELFEGRGEDREQIGFVRKVKLADRSKLKELFGKHVTIGAFKEAQATQVNVNLSMPTYRIVDE
jgi:phage terminase small subunit